MASFSAAPTGKGKGKGKGKDKGKCFRDSDAKGVWLVWESNIDFT